VDHGGSQAHSTAVLLAQLALILITSRLLAEGARRLGQPAVLGELFAGIILGPTVLGALAPDVGAALFPATKDGLQLLQAISWLGMVLLLFLIGAETDVRSLRRLGRTAIFVSIGGLTLPFISGLVLGHLLPDELVPATTTRWTLAAFLATALSISAMAVIAKILSDLKLAGRDVGIIVLGAAVMDDIVCWILLAVVSGLGTTAVGGAAHNPLYDAGMTLLAVSGFLVGARFLALPALSWLTRFVDDHFVSAGSNVAVYAAVAFAFAALADKLGLHAVFGAFIAGCLVRIVPRVHHEALGQLREVVGSILAPIFFAFVGLKVDLTQLGDIGVLAIVVTIAIAAKVVGAFLGAKLGGLRSRAALLVGAAMSARGSGELVVALVGLSLGILSPTLYSVIVVMAITTALVAPIMLRFIARGLPLEEHERRREEDAAATSILPPHVSKCLVPAAGGPNAAVALRLAARLCRGEGATLTTLHVKHPKRDAPNIDAHLAQLASVAKDHDVSVVTERVVSEDVVAAVLEASRGKDFLLIGASKGKSGLARHPVGPILVSVPCHAVVACAHGTQVGGFRRILVPMDGSIFSRAALELAIQYAESEEADITIVHVILPRAIAALRAEQTGARALSNEVDRVREALTVNLAPLLKRSPRPVTIDVIAGDDGVRSVLRHLEYGNFDLLVMGAENRAVGAQLFVGHGVEALIEEASCSVALVLPKL